MIPQGNTAVTSEAGSLLPAITTAVSLETLFLNRDPKNKLNSQSCLTQGLLLKSCWTTAALLYPQHLQKALVTITTSIVKRHGEVLNKWPLQTWIINKHRPSKVAEHPWHILIREQKGSHFFSWFLAGSQPHAGTAIATPTTTEHRGRWNHRDRSAETTRVKHFH